MATNTFQLMSQQSWLGLGKETTRGSVAACSTFVPIQPKQSVTSKIIWLKDQSLRGSPVNQVNETAGVGYFEYNFSGNIYSDSFVPLLLAALGGPDTVTGAGPYLHTIPLLNSASVGSQPPSYTVYDVDNIAEGAFTSFPAKVMSDGQLSMLDITFNADGAATYKATWACNLPVQGQATAPTWTTENFIPAWNTAASVAPTANSGASVGTLNNVLNIEEATISIKRNAVPEWTVGQQSPHNIFAGPIDVTGKFKFVAEAFEQNFAHGLSTYPQYVSTQMVEPVTGHFVQFQMHTVQFEDPVILREKSYEEVSVNWTASANVTDVPAGAPSYFYSPITCTASNAVSSAY